MDFVVCIKQVPDINAPVDTGRLILNAYDASAVEEALVLTEKYGGTVRLVLAGPEKAGETIRKALAMGADSATHLICEDEGLDSAAFAKILADHLAGESFDVIACGKQSQDTDSGLTGPMIASRLGLAYASNAVGLEIQDEELIVTRQADSGQEILALKSPCLVTCSNDMNDPRIPTLKGIMAARKKTITEKRVTPGAASTRILGYEPPQKRPAGRMITGSAEEAVAELVKALSEEARLL